MFLLRHLSCTAAPAAPVVTGDHSDVERRQQSQQFTAGLIGSGAKRVGQNTARFGIVSLPDPVLLRLTTNEAPLRIKFTDKGNVIVSNGRRRYPAGRELFKARMTVLMPIFNVLTVSRTPASLKALSTICCLTPGSRFIAVVKLEYTATALTPEAFALSWIKAMSINFICMAARAMNRNWNHVGTSKSGRI